MPKPNGLLIAAMSAALTISTQMFDAQAEENTMSDRQHR